MARLRERYLVDEAGKKTAVVLPLKEYERLLEDLRDLSIAAERGQEETLSLDEIKRRLKADGLIPD